MSSAEHRPLADRWPASGLLIAGGGIHLFFLLSLSTGWLDLLFNDASHTRQGFDFSLFYLTGKALEAGRDIYAVRGAFGYRYLPPFAQTFGRFFALFPPRTAYLVYLAITELFLAFALWLTWRWDAACGRPDPLRRALALFIWLAFSPFYLELHIGQVSFWAAALLFFLFYALDRPLHAGVAWTAAILIKPNALILLPALLRLRRFRTIAGSLLAVLLVSFPYFLVHPDGLTTFLDLNLSGRHFQGALTHAGNLGLWGGLVSLAAKLAGIPLASLSALSDLPLWGGTIVLLPTGGLLVAALIATFAGRCRSPLPPVALWLTTYFLVYKDVWEHHFVFLLPVLVALWLTTEDRKLLIIYALIALPTPFFLFDVSPGTQGAIDPERQWPIWISLCYRSFALVPLLYLWQKLLRRTYAGAGAAVKP